MVMRDVDIAYLAGLFDGEGSVMLIRQQARTHTKTRPYYLAVSLTNTHRGVMRWALRTVGYGRLNPRPGACFWKAHSRQAASFLKLLRPFLKIKRLEADVALTFQAHIERYKHQGYKRIGLQRGRPVLPKRISTYRESLRQRIYAIRRRHLIT